MASFGALPADVLRYLASEFLLDEEYLLLRRASRALRLALTPARFCMRAPFCALHCARYSTHLRAACVMLLYAVQSRSETLLRWTLECAHVPLGQRNDPHGMYVLGFAAVHGTVPQMVYLQTRVPNWRTASAHLFDSAAHCGRADMLQHLLAHAYASQQRALEWAKTAARARHDQVALELYARAHRADPQQQQQQQPIEYRITWYCLMAMLGDLDALERHGVPPQWRTNEPCCVTYAAAARRQHAILDWLRAQDVFDRRSAIRGWIECGDVEALRSVEPRDALLQMTSLCLDAVDAGQYGVLREVLQWGARCSARVLLRLLCDGVTDLVLLASVLASLATPLTASEHATLCKQAALSTYEVLQWVRAQMPSVQDTRIDEIQCAVQLALEALDVPFYDAIQGRQDETRRRRHRAALARTRDLLDAAHADA